MLRSMLNDKATDISLSDTEDAEEKVEVIIHVNDNQKYLTIPNAIRAQALVQTLRSEYPSYYRRRLADLLCQNKLCSSSSAVSVGESVSKIMLLTLMCIGSFIVLAEGVSSKDQDLEMAGGAFIGLSALLILKQFLFFTPKFENAPMDRFDLESEDNNFIKENHIFTIKDLQKYTPREKKLSTLWAYPLLNPDLLRIIHDYFGPDDFNQKEAIDWMLTPKKNGR